MTDEKLFRAATDLENEKFKIVKLLNTMNLQKIGKKISQMFCLHQAFCHLHQNQDLDLSLLALTNYFFFYHG